MPHRKRVRHYHEPGHLHELTFSCHDREPLLSDDDWRAKLSTCVDKAGEETAIELVAFVFMPEHVHLLVSPTTPEPDIGFYLARIKQPFSRHIKELLIESKSRLLSRLLIQERPGKTCFRVWMEGPGFDRNLFTHVAITASLDYIHSNPVKRGLCRRAIDWKWSSARFYAAEPPSQQYPDLPFVHGLPVGALD